MDDRGRRQPPRRRTYGERSQRKNRDDYDYDEYDYELDDQEEPRRQRPLPARQRQRPAKKRSMWPLLLMGCGLGVLVTVLGAALVVFLALRTSQGGSIPSLPILNTTKSFTKDEKQTLASLTSLTQLQVCDKVGNVSIKVDQSVSVPTITAHKTVQANNQASADQAFQALAVQAAPAGTITKLSCLQSPATATAQANANSSLTVNVTFPDSNGLVRVNNNTVDLAILLPPATVQSDGPQLALNVEAPVGNISVDGLSGLLNIRGGTGNVSVSHAALADNSNIDTGQGNVTFNGLLILPGGTNATAHYFIRSEQGTLDVTLPTGTSATLDANTNVGTITTNFPITIKANSDGSASYNGPLTASTTAPNSVVVVDVSTGNINIHQLQSSS
jgi:hypothetical protein